MRYLILTGMILFGAKSFASGKYYVDCTSENIDLSFATFGSAGSELLAKLSFQGKERQAENFKLMGKYQYIARVENLEFFFEGYPQYRGEPIKFTVSIRMFGDEFYPLEEGICQD